MLSAIKGQCGEQVGKCICYAVGWVYIRGLTPIRQSSEEMSQRLEPLATCSTGPAQELKPRFPEPMAMSFITTLTGCFRVGLGPGFSGRVRDVIFKLFRAGIQHVNPKYFLSFFKISYFSCIFYLNL